MSRQCLHRLIVGCASFLLLALHAGAAIASGQPRELAFDIPAQPLDQALLEYARQSGLAMAAVGDLRTAPRSRRVQGVMTAEAALGQLLRGSDYAFSIEPDGIVRVTAIAAKPPAAPRHRPARTSPQRRPGVPASHLGTVLVSARKREEQWIDVPIAISIRHGEQIDALGLSNATEALSLMPGVSAVDAGQSQTQVQIRGVSSSLGGNDNGYYLDDIPFTGVSVPWHPDTRAFDLERVEVLKGPQGSLFGEGSMGGTVRILTRAPDPAGFAARVSLGLESAAGDTGTSRRVMANLPLLEGKAAVRIVSTHERLPAWIAHPDDRRATNAQEADTTRLRLRWTEGRWTTDVGLMRFRTDAPHGGYAANEAQIAESWQQTRASWQATTLGTSAGFERTRLTLTAAKARLEYASAGTFPADPPVDVDMAIAIDVATYEARLAADDSGPFDWVIGYSRRNAVRSDRFSIDDVASRARQTNHANAVFGEATLASADDRWSYTMGLRYFVDEVDVRTAAGDTDIVGTSRFSRLNPRLIVTRHLTPRRSMYASVSTGFRSGLLQPAESKLIAQNIGVALPDQLIPDTIVSYDIGIKHVSDGGRMLLQGALFHSRWSNLPVRVPLDGVYNGVINSDGADIDGIELGVGLVPLQRLRIDFGGTLVHARHRGDTPGTPLSDGAPLYNVPRRSLFATAGYRWPVGATLAATLDASAYHHSRRETGLVQGEHGDGITRLDLRAGLESPRGWSGHLYGDNLLDERGAVDGRDLSGNATRLRPRTFGIEIRYDH